MPRQSMLPAGLLKADPFTRALKYDEKKKEEEEEAVQH